jgi:hypothetical protein
MSLVEISGGGSSGKSLCADADTTDPANLLREPIAALTTSRDELRSAGARKLNEGPNDSFPKFPDDDPFLKVSLA